MNNKFQEILKELLKENIKNANEIYYALDLLNDAFENSQISLKSHITKALNENDFKIVQKLSEYCDEINHLSLSIDEILDYISKESEKCNIITTGNKNTGASDCIYENSNTKMSTIDYSQYETNRLERHSLNEDFMHKKICAFELEGKHYNVKSWQDALVKLCRELAKKDGTLMKTFVNHPDFSGRKNSYFMNKYVPEKNRKVSNADVYVWINLSANDIVKLIKTILDHYHISFSSFSIYLRADYTDLHK